MKSQLTNHSLEQSKIIEMNRRRKQQSFFPPLFKSKYSSPDPLKRYQDELQDRLLKKYQRQFNQKDSRNNYSPNYKKSEINNIGKEIETIKNKIKRNIKTQQISKKLNKLNQISETITSGITLIQPPNNSQPVYQFFHPINSYLPHFERPYLNQNTIESQSQQSYKQLKPAVIKRQKMKHNIKKRMKNYKRYFNKQNLRKRLKVIFLVVSYTIFLKNYVKKLSFAKKQLFSNLWPKNYQNEFSLIHKFYAKSCQSFFILAYKLEDEDLSILQDDSQKVKEQKIKTIKLLINNLIQNIQKTLTHPYIDKISKMLFIFCKHGSYVHNGILTKDELYTVCISQQNEYLRLDKEMQKSLIIIFLFNRIILHDMVLQPWKLDNQNFNYQKETLRKNVYFIGSLLYNIFLSLQDYYLQIKRPLIYKIGNFLQLNKKVKFSPSLIYFNKQYDQAHLISGLIELQQINQLMNLKIFKDQFNAFKQIIDCFHTKMRIYGKKIKQQAFNGKKIFNPRYQTD